MSKPKTRGTLPKRSSENTKRRLDLQPEPGHVAQRFANISYEGSSKHKRHPHLYNLEPFLGSRGDATLCDTHASFGPTDMARVPLLLTRARRAALLGSHIWTVDDTGWIYELTPTNETLNQHHGYPLLGTEAITEEVFRHFMQWANVAGTPADRAAAFACQSLYGFKP